MATTTKPETKTFDAVRFMREARDRIHQEVENLSFEEQLAYLERRAAKVRRDLLPQAPKRLAV